MDIAILSVLDILVLYYVYSYITDYNCLVNVLYSSYEMRRLMCL